MKQTLKHSVMLLGTVLLLSFTACQREKDKVSDNPLYDPNTNTVKTDFVLSVSTSTGKDTKTTAEMAQVGQNATFLGMDQVHLLAYALDNNNKASGAAESKGHFFFNPVVNESAVAATRDYDLGTLFRAGTVTQDQASRSVELSLPLATNAVLFYGKATKTYDSDLQGSTLTEGDPTDLTTLKFTLEPRLTSMNDFEVGAFFFSRMFTYVMASGLVNENTFWNPSIGTMDKSYGFWWDKTHSKLPDESEAAILAEAFPAPEDQNYYPTDGTLETAHFIYYSGQLSWKQLGLMYYYTIDGIEETNPNTVVKTKNNCPFTSRPLGDVLGDAYYVMTTIKEQDNLKELRAGSATSVLRTIQDLYAVVERGVNAEPTNWEEHCAKLLSREIQGRILQFFTMSSGSLTYLKNSEGKYDISALKSNIETATNATDWSTIKEKVAACTDDELRAYFPDVPNGFYGFPVNVGLPFGAAIISCSKTNSQDILDTFSYVTEIPAYGFGGTATFPIQNYRYPPELMYYGNSALRTSTQVKKATDYPSSIGAWNTSGQWSGWENQASVTSDTRSVAMINNINYGTALLKSSVRYSDEVIQSGVLKDNNEALHTNEEDIEIPINGGGFLVTGIIIGAQPDAVGWDYCRRPKNGAYAGLSFDGSKFGDSFQVGENDKFDKMIYDRVIGGYTVGSTTTPIYTLAWDNYDATLAADQQSDVYVGIELMNNTEKDFWGEMNLVRAGGVFYLLGKLDLSVALANAQASQSSAFADLSRSSYCYPPFNPATGETINAPRVFMQDYMTTANLILNTDCLKHAYVTLPDLRSSQVSLGVSIDMSWTPGLAFDVNMGVLE